MNVRIAKGQILIGDEPRLLLCASLFYFRIPRGEWRDRLRAVRESGYTCIDVYFPWNHHELAPGEWDFAGERDAAAFLAMAHEEGLMVLARPGPYICSEWDGGGLPAWLPLTDGLRLRQNEPLYLAQVRRWFDRILPILRDSPAVILLQVENELDFFDCDDPAGYIAALRDMALEHGIGVPLVACAGQGDLARASGETDGVLAAANFYPDDSSLGIETVVEAYQRHLAERGEPLLITETNRPHVTLRRLLSTGARLIGPYLQASGNDFGFTNAVNNWGSPLALLTSDYDFGGYLSPSGVARPEHGEARLLAAMIAALGPALAGAEPVQPDQLTVTADFPLPDGGPRALALDGGGILLALANPGDHDGAARVKSLGFGEIEVGVRARSCPFVLLDLPIAGHRLEVSTAELIRADSSELVFSCDGPSIVVLVGEDGERTVFHPGGGTTERAKVGDLLLTFLPRADVTAPDAESIRTPVDLEAIACGREAATGADAPRVLGTEPTRPERLGAYRGYAFYTARSEPGLALLLHRAGDVLSAYTDGHYLGTVTPGGGFALLPRHDGGRLEVRTEIWGHSNFDDPRLPALRLGSLRGFDAATSITAIHRLSTWRIAGHGIGGTPSPYAGWGGWITSRQPHEARYTHVRSTSEQADTWVLRFEDLQAHVEVTVNDVSFGPVNPHDPFVDITPALRPGGEARIELTLRRLHSEAAGEVTFLEGTRATAWTAAFAEEQDLWRAAQTAASHPAALPVRLPPGELHWLQVEVDHLHGRSWTGRLVGSDLKVTAFFNGHLVGRMWLPGETRPMMKGGSPDLFALPAPWFTESGNRLCLLAEAVHPGRPGELREIIAER
ncbi:beta-galactosidase [Nonomuraea antri]|uniref:beta-galactosidase n=1 Tax=Nonomuraea antri TaxID=2730852 RepID=UPI001C2B9192|nr:beta-galactosidase [Nonomuraea antri]